MSRSPIVHYHFMLHFYERINDDDDDGYCDRSLSVAMTLNDSEEPIPPAEIPYACPYR